MARCRTKYVVVCDMLGGAASKWLNNGAKHVEMEAPCALWLRMFLCVKDFYIGRVDAYFYFHRIIPERNSTHLLNSVTINNKQRWEYGSANGLYDDFVPVFSRLSFSIVRWVSHNRMCPLVTLSHRWHFGWRQLEKGKCIVAVIAQK